MVLSTEGEKFGILFPEEATCSPLWYVVCVQLILTKQ